MEKGMATIFRIGLLHLQFLDNRHEHESTIFKSSPAVQATDILQHAVHAKSSHLK